MNVAADATEPRQSEESPREDEAKFRLLFEKSPDAMLLLDRDVFVDQQFPFWGCLAPIYTAHKPKRGGSMRVSGPRVQKTGLQIGILTSPILPNETSGYSHNRK